MAPPTDPADEPHDARYEFRVWGRHERARRKLAKLASHAVTEEIDDCYFLVDDTELNVKVRDRILKVKELVERTRGFERWIANRYKTPSAAPAPFDELFEHLREERERRGSAFDLSEAVARLDDDAAAKAVVVTKRRTRFRVGSMRAEVTDVTVRRTGEVLRTLAIEGDDLDELVSLRRALGLREAANVPVHLAIDPEQ